MPITVACDNPNDGVVVLTISDEWTWQEGIAALRQAIAIANRAGHKMCFAYDLSRNSYMPPTGLIQTIQEGVALCQASPNVDASLLIFNRAQGQLKTLISTALERYASSDCEFFYVNSLSEAFAVAKQRGAYR